MSRTYTKYLRVYFNNLPWFNIYLIWLLNNSETKFISVLNLISFGEEVDHLYIGRPTWELATFQLSSG